VPLNRLTDLGRTDKKGKVRQGSRAAFLPPRRILRLLNLDQQHHQLIATLAAQGVYGTHALGREMPAFYVSLNG